MRREIATRIRVYCIVSKLISLEAMAPIEWLRKMFDKLFDTENQREDN